MVRIHPDPPGSACTAGRGAVAQLGEHLLCKQGVVGSIPSSSTNAPGARVTINEWRPRGQAAATPKGPLRSGFSTGIGCSLTIGKKQTSVRRSQVGRWVRLYRLAPLSEFGWGRDRKRPCIAKATSREGGRVGSVMGSSD